MSYGTIVLVIDAQPLRKFLHTGLNAHGYEVIEAPRGEEDQIKCATATPVLMILDLELPDMNGNELITAIRSWSKIPIVVLSGSGGEAEKAEALDRGADDFVIKPFGIAEFMVRMRSTLRARDSEILQASEIKNGALSVDLARRRVRVDDADVKLTKKEFELLSLLTVNAGRVVTHQHLLKQLWGPAYTDNTHNLRTYIGYLRKKLRDDPANPRFIANEPGSGYRLVAGLEA